MRKFNSVWLLGLVLVLALGACTPPPAPAAPTLAPEPTTAPTTVAAEPTAEPTAEATATSEATATTEPTAAATETTESATGEVPDPKADPMAALLYASSAQAMKTAEFEYEMRMTMEAADDAAAEALGAALDVLKSFAMTATGSGALEIVDPEGTQNKMRMQLDMKAAGQQMQVEMIMVGDTVWTRAGEDGEWQQSDVEKDQSTVPGGMDPNKMLQSFKDATDAEWIEDTELDGTPVSHLRFTMDPTKFDMSSLTATLGENASAEEIAKMMQDMTIDADVWLTTDELQLRQERMLIGLVMSMADQVDNPDARIRINMDTTMRMLSVNEPVTIEPPTE